MKFNMTPRASTGILKDMLSALSFKTRVAVVTGRDGVRRECVVPGVGRRLTAAEWVEFKLFLKDRPELRLRCGDVFEDGRWFWEHLLHGLHEDYLEKLPLSC